MMESILPLLLGRVHHPPEVLQRTHPLQCHRLTSMVLFWALLS
jgi:hypothetical protein